RVPTSSRVDRNPERENHRRPTKPRHRLQAAPQPQPKGEHRMTNADKILQARNALHLCESLLLEAYVLAPEPIARAIQNLLVSLASDRTTIASLHQLAQQLPETTAGKRKPLIRASDLLDS